MPAVHRLAAVLLLVGCAAYDPPLAGDHAAPKYQADLVRCRKDAGLAARRKANATPQSLASAMFDSGDKERNDVLTCMIGRGHAVAVPAS